MAQRLSKGGLLDATVLLAVTGFLLTYFRPEYLFSLNITTGGDTASHYYTAQYMRDFLLPNRKITGWTQGNYGGFPMLQFYFPLPFLIMALLGFFIPLQIAFKLVTVLGIFLLPICAYCSLRLLRYAFPVPVFGALSTLPFLFMEANSMWGGNIPSTLAGEFAFSLGFAVSILFVGSIHRGIAEGRGVIKNSVILALVGLSHGYALLFSGIASLFFIFTTKDFLKKSSYLIRVYLLSFMLMGAWILPLLYYMPYTTRFNFVWQISSFSELFPLVLIPLLVIALIGRIIAVAFFLKSGAQSIRVAVSGALTDLVRDAGNYPLSYLWFCAVISAILYLVAYGINVVDIRFLPFLQIFICILCAVEAGRFAQSLRLNRLTPAIFCIMIFLWVNYNAGYTGDWIEWNYRGFENKPLWPQFSAINNYLKGDVSGPRVVYEHSALNNPTGTVRAFESLPLFSGRSTLEGIYMQSSPTSPFIFYIQSEISKEASCPLPDYACSPLNLKAAIRHLEMFNVRDFIVRSDAVKEEAQKYPDFRLEKEIPPYRIYELASNENAYVTPLKYEPVLYATRKWKTISYKWFKDSAINDVHIAFDWKPDEIDKKNFKTVISGDELVSLPRIPINGGCTARGKISNEGINIKTDCIHKPLLIKISYHPRWKAEGAKKIYLASPSFMLVFPEKEDVTLKFSETGVEKTGRFMSMAGLLIIAFNLFPFKKIRAVNLAVHGYTAISGRLREKMINLPVFLCAERRKKEILGVLFFAIIALIIMLGAGVRKNYPEAVFRKGMEFYKKKKFADARASFDVLTASYPVSTLARDSIYYCALSYYLEGDYQKTIFEFERLIRDFPESPAIPEAYFHIGLSYAKLNNMEKAAEGYKYLVANYPGTRWAGFAMERLRDITLKQGSR